MDKELKEDYTLDVAMEYLRTGHALDLPRLRNSAKVAFALRMNQNIWTHYEGNLNSILDYVQKTTGRKRKGLGELFSKGLNCKGFCCKNRHYKKIKINDL